MSEAAFEALRAAVRVARDRQIKSVRTLRRALTDMGFDDASITEALTTWGQHCREN